MMIVPIFSYREQINCVNHTFTSTLQNKIACRYMLIASMVNRIPPKHFSKENYHTKNRSIDILFNDDDMDILVMAPFHPCNIKPFTIFIGYNTAMVCQGPVLAHLRQYWPEGFSLRMPLKVYQYGPAAYHNRVVTFLLHIFGGFQYSQTKIAQTEKGDNKYFS